MYADDIVLYKKNCTEDTHVDEDLFKYDVQRVAEWCVANELMINIKKTKVQYFPSNRNSDCSV